MTDADDGIKFEPKSLCIKIIVCMIVLLVGAAIFMELEREKNDSIGGTSQATILKQSLAEKYNMSLTDLVDLEDAFEKERNNKEEAERLSRWTYGNSLFFAFTIMTTIGYGHISPHTWQGQLFCIFFSLISIPVAGIMLISVGNHVSLAIRVFIRFVEKTFLSGVESGRAELRSSVVTFVLFILMVIFGAVLTSHTDDWSFMEGMYFFFISVSTIGFGDYVVNDGELRSSDHSKTIAVNFTIVLITIGLCVLSSVLCSVSAYIEERQKQIRMRIPETLTATNAINAANVALNTVTSSLPMRLSTKFKGRIKERGKYEEDINQNGEASLASDCHLAPVS